MRASRWRCPRLNCGGLIVYYNRIVHRSWLLDYYRCARCGQPFWHTVVPLLPETTNMNLNDPRRVLTLDHLVEQSSRRCHRWHPPDEPPWSILEWAGAACGEAGECANAAKKIKRLTTGMAHRSERDTDLNAARAHCAKEAADAILYALIVIVKTGHDPVEVLRDVFNRKSEEYGFPERI